MLQSIRDHVQGWVAGIIIALIFVAFLFWGVQFYLEQMGQGEKAVATVNGQAISKKQLQFALRQMVRAQQSYGVTITPAIRKELRAFTIHALVSQTALSQAAYQAGFRVGLPEIKQLVYSLPQFQVNGKFSPARFQQLLYANSETPAKFFHGIKRTVLINQVAAGIEQSNFVLQPEVQQAYRLIHQRRSFGYFSIPLTPFLKTAHVTPQMITDYFKQHRDDFMSPEKVQLSYLLLSPETLAKTVDISDASVKQYYDSNKQNYRQPERWKISKILFPLPKGASDQQVEALRVKVNSLLSDSKKNRQSFSHMMKHGLPAQQTETKWVAAREISSQLLALLSKMKIDEVSSPLRVPQGIVIVRLDAMDSPKIQPLEKVAQSIKTMLIRQQVQQKLAEQGSQLANVVFTNPNTLIPAAKAIGLPLKTSSILTREGEKSGIFSRKNVLAAAFSNEVLKHGNNSAPIELKDGSLLVLRVKEHWPKEHLSLSDVEAIVRQRLVRQVANRQAGLRAYEVQSDLVKNRDINDIAKQYQLTWVNKKLISANDKSLPLPLLKAVFGLSGRSVKNRTSGADGKQVNSAAVTSALLKNGDYVVIRLFAVKYPQSLHDATDHSLSGLSTALASQNGRIDYQLYARGVLTRAKIKMH